MQTNPSASFGDLLRRFRLAAGLSQEELAERAGLSPRGVSDLERGARTNPRPGTVRLLAGALTLSDIDHAAFLAAARGAQGYASRISNADPQPTLLHEKAPDRSALSSPAPAPSTSLAPPTGTVTFLFTDIEGSTQLLQQVGARYADVLSDHQRILRAAFKAHNGYEVDTQGDSFFVAFPTAPDALAAAAEATRALAIHPWPAGMTLWVRMGLHTGAPQLVGGHYVGLDVHRAARIAAAGHGGQVLLSASTRALVEHDLPEGSTLRELGAHRLKDLGHPETISQFVQAELPADFPPLKSLDRQAHNLPIQFTPLIGRAREVADLCTLLRRDDVRLVTVTGPGGVGKTRLGLQVAADVGETFPDGIWFVRLAPLTDPTLVIPTIAQTLGLSERGTQPIHTMLREWLRPRQLLLLLDNCEHVAAAAPEVAVCLADCAGLKVLATSREELHVLGEQAYPLAPLALPEATSADGTGLERAIEQLGASAASPAVALFLARAQAHQPHLPLTAENLAAVVAICERLDGLPLAIELAAAHVKVLPPSAMLRRLERRLPLLVGGARDVEGRQQTMRATLAWSEDLLQPAERRLFQRLSVFAGSFTLTAAEAVCAAPAAAEPLGIEVLEGLERLVDQSLVAPWHAEEQAAEGEPRFRLLYVIREYAQERLRECGETEALQQAHAAYYVAFMDQWWAATSAAALAPQGWVAMRAQMA